MKDPSPATAGTQGAVLTLDERKLTRFVYRRWRRLQGTETGSEYFALLWQLLESERAAETRQFMLWTIKALEDGNDAAFDFIISSLSDYPDDVMIGVISSIARGRIKRRREAMMTSYVSYGTTTNQQTARPSQRVRIPQSRLRSREQSHAPRRSARSTPKTASRSGDSDPAGDPEPPRRRRFIVDDHYLVVAVVG